MANTLKFGNGEWYGKKDTILAYNDENNNYKPLPFDFSRGSTPTGSKATTINKDGLIETVGNNVPRIDYKDDSKGALLLEPSRTNVILQSQDITTGWSQGNIPTLTSNIAVAPDGTMTADGIQSESDGAFRTVRQLSISISANSTVTNSYFVKKETSEINYGGFGFVFSGGTTKVVYGIVNSVNGTVTYDTNLTATTKVEDYGSYWRISSTVTDTGSNTSLGVYYYGTLSINGTSLNTGVGSVRTIWGMQLELNSSYATSYIPTQGGVVTRLADSDTKQVVTDSVIGQTEGTIFYDINLNNIETSSQYVGTLSDGSSTNRIQFLNNVSEEWQLFISASTISNNINLISSTNGVGNYKIAIAYKSGDVAYYVNGVQKGTSTETFTFSNLLHFDIGQRYDDSLYFYNPIREAKLYNTRLSNSELQALTTI